MIYKNIMIRTLDYLKMKGYDSAFTDTTVNNRKYPLYYQYCQNSKIAEESDITKIGEVFNIHIRDNIIVCDVQLDVFSKVSDNFNYVIDNYVLGVEKDRRGNINYKIARFVIYNKDFKRKVEEKMKNEQENNQTQDNMSVCMEIAAAESIPELNVEAPKASN